MKLKYFCIAIAAVCISVLTACSDFMREKMDVVDMNLSGNVISFEAAPSTD